MAVKRRDTQLRPTRTNDTTWWGGREEVTRAEAGLLYKDTHRKEEQNTEHQRVHHTMAAVGGCRRKGE